MINIRATQKDRQKTESRSCRLNQVTFYTVRTSTSLLSLSWSGTSTDKFWYTYDGLRKSVIFEAPKPDQDGNIKVHIFEHIDM